VTSQQSVPMRSEKSCQTREPPNRLRERCKLRLLFLIYHSLVTWPTRLGESLFRVARRTYIPQTPLFSDRRRACTELGLYPHTVHANVTVAVRSRQCRRRDPCRHERRQPSRCAEELGLRIIERSDRRRNRNLRQAIEGTDVG
jgi:hypothetical protein